MTYEEASEHYQKRCDESLFIYQQPSHVCSEQDRGMWSLANSHHDLARVMYDGSVFLTDEAEETAELATT